MTTRIYLVTGATGKQGGAVVNALLRANQHVRAITRDASSPQAQSLASRGVELFETEYSNASALTKALSGCHGVFANFVPNFTIPSGEYDDGHALILAAKSAGVAHLIYTSVASLESMQGTEEIFGADSLMGKYHANKSQLEEETKTVGFEHWTILRPATFMTNYIAPDADFQYPDLSKRGVLRTAYEPDTKHFLVDPADVAQFAAAAFADPDRFHGKVIDIATEVHTIGGIRDLLAEVSGREVGMEGYSEEEVREMFMPKVHVYLNKNKLSVDVDEAKAWGFPLAGFREFLEGRKEVVVRSVGPL